LVLKRLSLAVGWVALWISFNMRMET
jgi:hypothetical protein